MYMILQFEEKKTSLPPTKIKLSFFLESDIKGRNPTLLNTSSLQEIRIQDPKSDSFR